MYLFNVAGITISMEQVQYLIPGDLHTAQEKRKVRKLAMMTVENKLVRQTFAVIAHGKAYVDGVVSNRP